MTPSRTTAETLEFARAKASSAEAAQPGLGEKVTPRVGGITQCRTARVLRVADENLSIRRGDFYAVTVVHAALSLPPDKLTWFNLGQRQDKLLTPRIAQIVSQYADRVLIEANRILGSCGTWTCEGSWIVIFRPDPRYQFD